MIDRINDESSNNKCEFCNAKSMFVYFDSKHLTGMDKKGSSVLCCDLHEEEAKQKVMGIIKCKDCGTELNEDNVCPKCEGLIK